MAQIDMAFTEQEKNWRFLPNMFFFAPKNLYVMFPY